MNIPWHYASVLAVLIIVLVWQLYAEDGYLNEATFGRSQLKLAFHAFNLTGRAFDTALVTYLDRFDLREAVSDLLPPVSDNWTPVFVTAASSDHFMEMRGALNSMWSRYPNATFVIYDIGLDADQSAEAVKWCNVEFKKFAFDKYPAHFRTGKKYAWKFGIIAEQLKANREFFWLDASGRLSCDDLSVFPKSVRNSTAESFLIFREQSQHSIFAATHPGMYEYFPQVNLEFLKAQTQKESNVLFFSDSNYTRELVKWALLCALTEDCIDPPGAQLRCNFTDGMNVYGGCHRYDQSLYTVLRTQMLFLDGFYERLDGTPFVYDRESVRRNWTVPTLEQFRHIVSEWDKRIAPFGACLYPAREERYTGSLPQCPE
ncbi:Protein R05A10.7 [Aphelenchoides avenae]|nr:Protein R05A10.7 [Aphelenchus avenae]